MINMQKEDKHIKVKNEVYLKLFDLKRPGDSFSNVIERLLQNQCDCNHEIPRVLYG
jgi:predicted CopG family antitoxin